MPSDKTPVIEHLYNEYIAGRIANGIVMNDDIVRAINATGSKLSKSNPANFLKDIIRKESANGNWPDALKKAGVTARQRYREKRVFQFVNYAPGQTEPFPDRFLPNALTRFYELQSATVPSVARALGRPEESWLMQVVVALRVVETHLSLFSPLRSRLHDVTHLQMSRKTQPEVDAVYLLSYANKNSTERDLYFAATCEAKQNGERILEDQIREQVSVVFAQSKSIKHPPISSVLPLAIQVREVDTPSGKRKGIFVVEFEAIERAAFEASYESNKTFPEKLYGMPLTSASTAVYLLSPKVKGIDA